MTASHAAISITPPFSPLFHPTASCRPYPFSSSSCPSHMLAQSHQHAIPVCPRPPRTPVFRVTGVADVAGAGAGPVRCSSRRGDSPRLQAGALLPCESWRCVGQPIPIEGQDRLGIVVDRLARTRHQQVIDSQEFRTYYMSVYCLST